MLEGAAANAPLGATVTVHFAGTHGGDLLQVPVAALLDRGHGTGVWVVRPSGPTVAFQNVQVRQIGEELATVSGNLQPDERIVALGVHLLHDGEQVRVETKGDAQ